MLHCGNEFLKEVLNFRFKFDDKYQRYNKNHNDLLRRERLTALSNKPKTYQLLSNLITLI